jgi:hypothetical protein
MVRKGKNALESLQEGSIFSSTLLSGDPISKEAQEKQEACTCPS